MRFPPKYQNADRTLVRLDGRTVVPVDALCAVDVSAAIGVGSGSVVAVRVLCSDVELSPLMFNEDYLARLRDFLKEMEAEGVDAVIVPVANNIAANGIDRFVATMVHTARRIKDCASVVGFALPDEVASDAKSVGDFIGALCAKHPQYVYFASKTVDDKRLIPYGMRKNA